MNEKRRAPGSRKGEAKPVKRKVDEGFSRRLDVAMRSQGYTLKGNGDLDVSRLARESGCTRAVIHKYLKPGETKMIEALLLFDIADKLNVSARWLLKNEGAMTRIDAATPEQMQVLNLYSNLNENMREVWLSHGETLHRHQPPLVPHTGDPFRSTPHTLHQPEPAKHRR